MKTPGSPQSSLRKVSKPASRLLLTNSLVAVSGSHSDTDNRQRVDDGYSYHVFTRYQRRTRQRNELVIELGTHDSGEFRRQADPIQTRKKRQSSHVSTGFFSGFPFPVVHVEHKLQF